MKEKWMNKKEIPVKELMKTIRNLATKSLKQQPIQPQSFTSESDENCHIFDWQSRKWQRK